MKVKCPKCEEIAELADDFSYVRCSHCSLDMTYGEYVKYIAYKDSTYSDILGDYTSTTEGTTAGTLDDW
ncbi:MAG: hypothetical protein ACRD94_03375 [Nitrosopumilaceae archaeon]|jgi:phage FluMu protein Com|nr:hypothetical protein [Nitrosopumilaceae archaeon]